MKIHNLMEDIVLEHVNDVFQDEEARQRKGFCTCSQCRMDVACYVLNRTRPFYMLSGRGLAHLQMDYQEKLQREADLVSLVHKGIDHVSQAKRPHFPHHDDQAASPPRGPFFNFPQITGRLFNSVTFEPAAGVEVALLDGEELVAMVDSNWQNPYPMVSRTAGVFTFWPHPRPAAAPGDRIAVELEVAVEAAGFAPFHHYFGVELESGELFLELPVGQRVLNLPDLYLIPEK